MDATALRWRRDLHDSVADISYGIIAPADAVPGDLMACYEQFCEPVLDAFERMGVDASFADDERSAVHQPACYLRQLHPAHDIVGPDGRKLERERAVLPVDAVIHHGSLSVSLRPDRHCGCFTADPDSERFTERVGAIDEYADIDRADASRRSADAGRVGRRDRGPWTDDELARAREHAKETFVADEWIRRSP